MEKKEGYTVFSGPVKGPKGEKAIIQAEKHGKEVETFKKGTFPSPLSLAYQQRQPRCQARRQASRRWRDSEW